MPRDFYRANGGYRYDADVEESYQSVVMECAQLKSQLQGVLESRSWRITAPLRRLMALLRRIKEN